MPTEALEETAVEVPVIGGEEPAPTDVIVDSVDPEYVVGTLTWEALEEMRNIVEDLTLAQLADLDIEAHTLD